MTPEEVKQLVSGYIEKINKCKKLAKEVLKDEQHKIRVISQLNQGLQIFDDLIKLPEDELAKEVGPWVKEDVFEEEKNLDVLLKTLEDLK